MDMSSNGTFRRNVRATNNVISHILQIFTADSIDNSWPTQTIKLSETELKSTW